MRIAAAAAIGIAGALGSGCSTVVMREPAAAVADERSELALAAEAISARKWPRSDSAGISGMFGERGSVTEAESIAAYVDQLGQGPGRGVVVLKDAYVHIDAAYRLASATDRAASLTQPTDEDVRLVESAIGDLRGARDIYLATLRELEGEGDGVELRTEQSLKAAFNEAIREIGEAADVLSDRVAAKKLQADAMRRSSMANFAGQ